MVGFCKQCGKELKDYDTFCRGCGAKVPSLEPLDPQILTPKDRSSLKHKEARKNKNLVIAVFSIVGLIAIAIAAFFIVNAIKDGKKEVAQTAVTTTAKNEPAKKEEPSETASSKNNGATNMNQYTKKLDDLKIHTPGEDLTVGKWKISNLNGTLFLEANNIPSKDLSRIYDLYDAGDMAPLQEWAKNVYNIAEDLSHEMHHPWNINVGNSCTSDYPDTLSMSDLREYSATCGYSIPVLAGENKENLSLMIKGKVFGTANHVSTTNNTSGDYILPDSDFKKLTESDIAALTVDQLRLARNEIYARHGYIFQSEELQSYFSQKSWYSPNVSFNGNTLSEVEKTNVELIQNRERNLK